MIENLQKLNFYLIIIGKFDHIGTGSTFRYFAYAALIVSIPTEISRATVIKENRKYIPAIPASSLAISLNE